MNENETMLRNKIVYLCMADPNSINYMESGIIDKARRIAIDYQEEYGCRVIAPYAYLCEIVDYEDKEEMEVVFWFCRKMQVFADAIVVFGDCLSDRMRVEIDYAWLHGIPIITRPESFAPVHEYLDSLKRRNEDAGDV